MANTADETGREGPVGQATSHVQEAASTAQEKAVELKEKGKGKLGETLDQRTTQAGQQTRQMAQALRESSEQLRSRGEGEQAVGLANGVAERMERLGSYLERADGDELLRDVESFARRRPWMIAGVGLLAGVAASRFLKASAERRYGSPQRSGFAGAHDYPLRPQTAGAPDADEALTRESFASSR